MGSKAEWVWLEDQFKALPGDAKLQWLAGLMYAITMCARAAYGDAPDSGGDANRLRRFNELLHRVATYNVAVIKGDPQRLPDEILISMLVEELPALGAGPAAVQSMMGVR